MDCRVCETPFSTSLKRTSMFSFSLVIFWGEAMIVFWRSCCAFSNHIIPGRPFAERKKVKSNTGNYFPHSTNTSAAPPLQWCMDQS